MSTNKAILEVCVDSVESAIAAAEGGADRLELCSNLIIGGTTPSVPLFKEIKKVTDIPIRVLIRPRFGDFCYTDYEFSIIREEVKTFKELGADGVVIGILNADGRLDIPKMKTLIDEAEGIKVTLHRAFDVCVDPYEALQQAKELGIDTILTSGQKNSCLEGKVLLKELVERAGNEINILIGSGVNAEVISELVPFTKAHCFHMSGKMNVDSGMNYRKDDVAMGLPMMSEYIIWRTDKNAVMKARDVLNKAVII